MRMLDAERWRYIDATAAHIARNHYRLNDVDDFIAEARCAIVAEIRRRPDLADAAAQQLGQIVNRRLTDWHRKQAGRHHPKPHHNALSIDAPIRIVGRDQSRITLHIDLASVEQPPEPDVAALRAWLVSLCRRYMSRRGNAVPMSQWEIVIDGMLSETMTMQQTGDRLGISESRVSQLTTKVRTVACAHRDELPIELGAA